MQQLSYFPRLVSRITELAGQGWACRRIAEQINTEGLRPPKRCDRFTEQSMRDVMGRLNIRPRTRHGQAAAQAHLGEGEWSLRELAHLIGMPPITLYNWVTRGWVAARQEPGVHGRWIIIADDTEIDRIRQLHQRPRGWHNRRRWIDTTQHPDQEGQTTHAAQT